MRRYLARLVSTALLIQAAGFAQAPATYSLEKEIALSRMVAQEIEKENRLVEDPAISGYIAGLVQSLASHSEIGIPVTVKVLDKVDADAQVLPAGLFYVNSGLILRAATESELAAALAHGIAHIAARHAVRQATQAQLSNLSSIPLIFTGGSWKCYDVHGSASILVPKGYVALIRTFDPEADSLGLQYLRNAGFDPNAYVEFFERVQAGEPSIVDRMRTARTQIQEMPSVKTDYIINTSGFDDVKAKLISVRALRRTPSLSKNPLVQ